MYLFILMRAVLFVECLYVAFLQRDVTCMLL